MSPFIFTKAILNNEPIKVFNHGNMMRDFTFIDDIVVGIANAIEKIPENNPNWKNESASSSAPYKIYNLGASKPVKLIDFIVTLEDTLKKQTEKIMFPMQQGDVKSTYADISDTTRDLNYMPQILLKEGIKQFVEWYLKYYQNN